MSKAKKRTIEALKRKGVSQDTLLWNLYKEHRMFAATVVKLTKRISALQSQSDIRRNMYQDLQMAHEALSRQWQGGLDTIKQLRLELGAAKFDTARKAGDSISDKHTETLVNADYSSLELRTLASENQGLRENISKLRDGIQDLHRNNDKWRRSNSELREQNDKLCRELVLYKSRLASQLDRQEEALAKGSKAAKLNSNRIAELEKIVVNVSNKLQSKEQHLQECILTRDRYAQELGKRTHELECVKAELQDLRKHQGSKEKRSSVTEAAFNALKVQLDDTDKRLASLRESYAMRVSQLEKAENALALVKHQNTKLQEWATLAEAAMAAYKQLSQTQDCMLKNTEVNKL